MGWKCITPLPPKPPTANRIRWERDIGVVHCRFCDVEEFGYSGERVNIYTFIISGPDKGMLFDKYFGEHREAIVFWNEIEKWIFLALAQR